MAIDYDHPDLTPEASAAVQASGLIDKPNRYRFATGSAIVEKRIAIPKLKRKQRGRGETQLERDFGAMCSLSKVCGEIAEWWFKPFVLRIGPAMTLEPDFMVWGCIGQVWVIDTKGPWVDGDSRVKIKIAAEKYPLWRWLIVTRPDHAWRCKEVTTAGIGRKLIELPWRV